MICSIGAGGGVNMESSHSITMPRLDKRLHTAVCRSTDSRCCDCCNVCEAGGVKYLMSSKFDLGGLWVRAKKQEGEVIGTERGQQQRGRPLEERLLTC